MGSVRTLVINATFESDIDEIVKHLNNCHKDVFFQKEHVVEDVLLNPGPADENIDNIIREVLDVQDVSWSGEDMNEVDNVP